MTTLNNTYDRHQFISQFSKVVFDKGFKNKFDQYIKLTVDTVFGGVGYPHNQHNCQRLVLEEPLGGRSPLRSGRLEWVIIWPRGEIITRLELGFTKGEIIIRL